MAFFIVITFALGEKSNIECPDELGFHDLGDYGCFHFPYFMNEVNWKYGQIYCQRLSYIFNVKADLAAIPDPITQAFLSAIADEYEDQSWFIGGTDENSVCIK